MIGHLDRISEAAAAIGAVNCVVRSAGELAGENTDGKAFLRALEKRRDPAGASVVLLGAGGVARAIGVELIRAGARSIVVVNRSEQRGHELAELLRTLAPATAVGCETWCDG